MPEIYNVAEGLTLMAEKAPYQPGVVFPAGRDETGRAKSVILSFQQLNEACDQYAHGLTELGIGMQDRVLLLLHPGAELIAVVFALLKMGAVPVLIDPGMGRSAFLQCVAETEPTALISIPIGQLLRRVIRKPFKHIRHTVVAEAPSWFPGVLAENTLAGISARGTRLLEAKGLFPIAPTTTQNEAAVAFTSGSTGIPKGVVYLHGMFQAQIAALRDQIGIRPGEVDLALLYIFALFNPALGVTTIIPDMDPTKSAEVNPAYVVESILTHGVTNAFGSPTIWKRVVPYCLEHNLRLPSLKRVIMAGAPVPPALIEALMTHILSEEAEVMTPFGATEAMPLTMISGRDIVGGTADLTAAGKGMCVGTPLPGITLRVIRVSDLPIPSWDESLILPPGEIGEIVVKGAVVTEIYLNRPEQTLLAKIREGDAIWHRMGDLGYFDEAGRLWFVGRKAHRVKVGSRTLYPVPCETIFNRHPEVVRTALVGLGPLGNQEPILVVESQPSAFPTDPLARQRFARELLALGADHEHTRSIKRVLFYPDVFPTDVRHNAKIQREKLAEWASKNAVYAPPDGVSAPVAVSAGVTATTADAGTRLRRQRPGDLMRVIGLIAGLGLSVWLVLRPRKSKDTGAGRRRQDR
jgi:olefin beta-lactone synthetase